MTPFDNCPTVGMYHFRTADGWVKWVAACNELEARVAAHEAWGPVHNTMLLNHTREHTLRIVSEANPHGDKPLSTDDFSVDLVVLP